MNVVEMHQWFDLIQDKVDSVYYTEVEKDQFINRSIQLFINDVIHKFTEVPNGPLVISSNLEESLNASEVLRPLMLIDLPVNTYVVQDEDGNAFTADNDRPGLITSAEIEAAIEEKSGETETFLHILSLSDGDMAVSYVRENDYFKLEQNEFKKATSTDKKYRISSEGVMITPTVYDATSRAYETYAISVIKAPKYVNYVFCLFWRIH